MDFHCHLDLYDDPVAVVERATKAGVYVLSVTTTPKAFSGTRRLGANSPRIRTALGFHPQIADQRQSELGLFDMILPETDYVGEIGLDGSSEHRSTFPIQIKIFRHILDQCDQTGGKILSVHSRHAAKEVLDELEENKGISTPILHWFSGSEAELRRAKSLDCWYSIGPSMFRTDKGRNHIRNMPADRVLLETDGPFGRMHGKSLEPIHAESVISDLSKIWFLSITDTAERLLDNLRKIGTLAKSN